PLARYFPSAATVGRLVLIVGGFDTYEKNNRVVSIYDSKTGRWSSTTAPDSLPLTATVVTVGTKALFSTFKAVDIYDVGTGQWSSQPVSIDRAQPVVVTVGDKVLFAGGTIPASTYPGSPQDSNLVNIYDSTS